MTLETWQIRVLQNELEDYQAWIDNVNNCGIFPSEKDGSGRLTIDEVIQNKINKCFERMIKDYSFESGLTQEEKVNLIIAQENYKNRFELEIEEANNFLQKNKENTIFQLNKLIELGESNSTDEEINSCTNLQDLNDIHIRITTHIFRLKVIELLNKVNLNSQEAPTEQEIRNCQNCSEIQIKKDLIIQLKKDELQLQ